MDYFEAMRLRAIRAVQKPDEASHLRYIHRWYSRNFHTPLHVVETLDPDDILSAFYEQTYEDMEEDDREKELHELLETDTERRARMIAKDIERAEFFEFAQFTAAEERRKEARKLADLKVPESRKFAPREAPESALPQPGAQTPMKDLKELPPDIEMKFVSNDDFEAELEGFGSMMPGKKPQSSK